MGALIRSVCTLCGFTGVPVREVKGSLGVEIALWFFFLVPGFIYSIWRSGSRFDACPHCKQPTMIPSISPNGAALIARNGGWSLGAEQAFQSAVKNRIVWGGIKVGLAWFVTIYFAARGLTEMGLAFGVISLVATAVFAFRWASVRTDHVA